MHWLLLFSVLSLSLIECLDCLNAIHTAKHFSNSYHSGKLSLPNTYPTRSSSLLVLYKSITDSIGSSVEREANDVSNKIPSFQSKSIKKFISSTSMNILSVVLLPYASHAINYGTLKSDELQVKIDSEFLGLGLKEMKYKGKNEDTDLILVVVQSIKPDADALLKQVIRPGMIIITIGDVPVEGYSGKEVVNLFKSISKPTSITFRDPDLFANRLDSSSLTVSASNTGGNTNMTTATGGKGGNSMTVGVMMNTNQEIIETEINYVNNEVLSVQRLNLGSFTPTEQHAKIGDVLEVEYSLQVYKSNSNDPMKVGNGVIFLGTSAYNANNPDKTLFFVLGKPLPQQSSNNNLPLGFDLGMRGMCVGEQRRIKLPSSLGYDINKKFENINVNSNTSSSSSSSVNLKTVKVVKNQPLLLDVKLISINGVA